MFDDHGKGSLMTLKFVSTPDAGLSPAALNLVVCQAWAHNMRTGITGEMALRDGLFHQTVEGPFDEIVPLASRILSDSRHHHIAIEHFGSIPARRYGCWSCTGFETLLPHRMPRQSNVLVVRLRPAVSGAPHAIEQEDNHAAVRGRIV